MEDQIVATYCMCSAARREYPIANFTDAAILLALFFLPRYLKSGIATVSQFLEDRFDAATRKIISILFLLFYIIAQLPIVLYTGAIGMEGIFHISDVFNIDKTTGIWIMVWSIGTLGAAYAIFGGLKAVAVSDTINGAGLIIGGLLIPVFGLFYIGQGSFFQGLDILWTEHPDKFDSTGAPDSSIPFATLFTGMFYAQVFYWCTNQAITSARWAPRTWRRPRKARFTPAS